MIYLNPRKLTQSATLLSLCSVDDGFESRLFRLRLFVISLSISKQMLVQ
jgi:hypothetical protein